MLTISEAVTHSALARKESAARTAALIIQISTSFGRKTQRHRPQRTAQ